MRINEEMKMEDIQKVSLDILKFIADICEKEGFRYFLMYGTLIGAVRHNGYIPWDDDVDIMMPRSDYEKFLEYARTHKSRFGYYEIFNRQSRKDYIYGITRVSDSRYEIVKDDEKNCSMGIFIDIYPYDGLGDDRETALKKLTATRKYCNCIVDITRKEHHIPSTLNLKGKISHIVRYIKNRILGVGYFLKKIDDLREDYQFDSSRYVGPLMWFFTKPEKVLFEKRLFENPVKLKFEDREFYVPGDYHTLLTQEYGDYMQLPPVEKRIYHHNYKAFKKG